MSPHGPALNTQLRDKRLNFPVCGRCPTSLCVLLPPAPMPPPWLTKPGHPPLLRLPPRQVCHCPHLRSSPLSLPLPPSSHHQGGGFRRGICGAIAGRHLAQTPLYLVPVCLTTCLGAAEQSYMCTEGHTAFTHTLFPSLQHSLPHPRSSHL